MKLKFWNIKKAEYGYKGYGLYYLRKDYLELVLCRMNGTHTKEEWFNLCKKYNFKCACCGSEVIGGMPCKDHIIPKCYTISSDSINNLQPLCRECNVSKGRKIIKYI